jgi:hypothetical protein
MIKYIALVLVLMGTPPTACCAWGARKRTSISDPFSVLTRSTECTIISRNTRDEFRVQRPEIMNNMNLGAELYSEL